MPPKPDQDRKRKRKPKSERVISTIPFVPYDLDEAMREMRRDLEGDPYFDKVSFSWLKKKPEAILPVWDQGPVGSCYGFPLTDAAVALYVIKGGELVSLSKQEHLDQLYNRYQRCNLKTALSMMKDYGVYEEDVYPYLAKKKQQSVLTPPEASARGRKFFIKNFLAVGREEGEDTFAIMDPSVIRTLKRRPLIGVMDAPRAFQKFKGDGIYKGVSSGGELPERPRHAVLIIGYGKDEDGVEFFLIKNSWGRDWGHKGFALVERSLIREHGYPIGPGFKRVDGEGRPLE